MVAANNYPRTYVPASFDPSDFAQVRPLFDELMNRAIGSLAELEQWLLDFSELSSVVDEYGSRKYIDKSCHTEDADIERAFMHFVEQIEPQCKPLVFALQKKFLESPYRAQLADPKYGILARQWEAEVDVFRDANVPLETQQTKLVTDYDKICGAMMVEFRGQTYTQQQLARFLEEPDRDTRREAWESGTARRLRDRDAIESIFDQLLPLRQTIAGNAGLPDYRAFTWKQLKRFDYSPADCERFNDAIAAVAVPIVRRLDAQRAQDLKVERLRPWDIACDPQSRPALRPFDPADVGGFIKRTFDVFQRISPTLADQFDTLRQRNNLDLDSRRGKQPGGYQSTLNESREPFIFMNAAGVHRDVETLLHEGGHAFHALAARDEPLVFLRHAPMEFCEVASMAMELFGDAHMDVFYPDDAERARARRVHLEGIIRFFPWMATIDGFQHWLYTHPNHTSAERQAEWLRLMDRFGSALDWTGHEDARAAWWQRQLHLFHVPFYYVEYGIAQLGALQLWMKSRTDPHAALAGYRAGLNLGGTRSLPELFRAAGIQFDFTEKTLRPLLGAVEDELAELAH